MGMGYEFEVTGVNIRNADGSYGIETFYQGNSPIGAIRGMWAAKRAGAGSITLNWRP